MGSIQINHSFLNIEKFQDGAAKNRDLWTRYKPELYTGFITSLFSFKYEQTDQDIFCVPFKCLAMISNKWVDQFLSYPFPANALRIYRLIMTAVTKVFERTVP